MGVWKVEDFIYFNTWFRDLNRYVRIDMSISWGRVDTGRGKRESLRLRRRKEDFRVFLYG